MIFVGQTSSSSIPISGNSGDIFVTVTDDRRLFTIYYEEYSRYMTVSLRLQNSCWVYSVYLEPKGWIDIDLFPQGELSGVEKIFIIDGPLLIACFSSQIRIYPLDIEGNYLQYHIPTGWKVGTVSTFAVCQIHLCIIEWSSAIIPTFWTIVPISNYLNRFSEKIESLAFPNSTNLSDGLWAAFFSSNPIPSTLPFLPPSAISQMQPGDVLSAESLSSCDFSQTIGIEITSWKILDVPGFNGNQHLVVSTYSDNYGNLKSSLYRLINSYGQTWSQCSCLTQTETNLLDQLHAHTALEIDQFRVSQIDILFFASNTAPASPSGYPPPIIILGLNQESSQKNSMILLISSVDLAILSVFCSVEYYCSSPSPKFGHRLYMIPSSSFANFGIFSFHSSDFISSKLVQSASNGSSSNMEYNDLQLVACDLTPDGIQEVSVLQRTKESVCSTAVMLTSHRHGYYDIVTDIISPRDQSKPGSKSKKKRKREVPTTTTDSSKNRKISLSELEAEKQLLMKAALQSRLYSSTDKVVRLFTLHKRKCETLFGLMLLCKETIQSLSPNTRVKSMKFTKYESICDILISDHYRPIFPEPTLSTNQSKIPLPELLPSHTLKSFSSRKLGLKRNETITSISPEHNLKGNGFREISSTTISEPNQRLEQRDTQHSTQLTTVTTKPFEVVGSFAKRVTGPLLNADYFIVVVCLRNSSRAPLYNLTLQAESIVSSESYFSYLENKYNSSEKSHRHIQAPNRCHILSSSVAQVPPGATVIVMANLTIHRLTSTPTPPHSVINSLDPTHISPYRALQRILRLHGGVCKTPTPVLVSLSNFVDIRLKFIDDVLKDQRKLPLPKIQLEESPLFFPNLSQSSSRFMSIGILSVLPEFHSQYSHQKYHDECQRNFYPHKVIRVYSSAEERSMWEHLNTILLSCKLQGEPSFIHGTLPAPSSYHLSPLTRSSGDIKKLKEILSSYSSSLNLASSLEDTIPFLYNFPDLLTTCVTHSPLFLTTTDNQNDQVVHIFPSLNCISSSSPDYLSNLRYDLAAIRYDMVPTKLTRGAIYKLFRSMEFALLTLMESIKFLAIAWREMNLFNQNHRKGERTSLEGRIYLSSRLWTINRKLYEDILYSQYLCDKAMVSFLITLQDYQNR